ncbi:MAG: Do family serine endopeptidase [Proteobacteria bacterium]|nr:Do family serine endopeptidase [Pseudomonadota bacterium]
MQQFFKLVFVILGLAGMLVPADRVLGALPVAVEGDPLPTLAPVLERVIPSVVNIYTQTRVRIRSPLLDDPFFRRFFNVPDVPRERVSQSLGSGVVVDAEQGYVLTNNHVIAGATHISVTLADGRSFAAEVIGTDPDTDLAMIRIPPDNLRALPLADSNQLRVGDFVVAVGNPFGLGQTVTSGIVSALGRAGFRGLEFQNFIQTDASINPGNSGGALINLRGELVGINSAIFTPSGGNVGIGFAIPSAMAKFVMDQLARFGEVRRGTLGIYVQDLTAELAGAFGLKNGKGALVAEVVGESAAERAGIQAGDVITAIADNPVNNAREFHNIEGQLPLGESVTLEFFRNREKQQTRLNAEALKVLNGGAIDRRLRGATFEELPSKLRSDRIKGVLLSGLESGSPLARNGLRPGDIITAVNRQGISDLSDFQGAVGSVRGGLYLQFHRNGGDYRTRID